ncbi:MAG: ATP-dependent zinc metalloprotease FtsH [Methylococcaceae bacterium]|jgi:cell division protease FtsH|nr:ATP-dependent zinc metalloprotease FtsH [Methylococcaceae bacterium]MDZ4155344.1 ATP-dependent zinc metalloprotease FtsH [Methylococcales bacterium]MDP2393956.1 ATP-dependent zinc metalloprotease FtsH [Methylococcaceae bacterium]MDP3018056.1 ATP-dependent zinc metalloprotease FtsH [Methylococcaceae bacterium]MDP3391833.1 ATP-dependent zinc metalloprotease FtsH [Methylococcaceae bacterium]
MNKKHAITAVKFISSVLNQLLSFLKTWFHSLLQAPAEKNSKQPDNKAKAARFVWVALALVAAISVFNQSKELLQDELPYNKFLQLVNDKRVEHVVISEKLITGLIKPENQSANPQHFITIPLWDEHLSEKLAEHNIDFVVRSGENWLTNLFLNWIIPLLVLLAIWSWMFKRMGANGHGSNPFLNIGNKVRIHSDTQPKITFAQVAGSEDAKQELKESIEFLKTPEKIQKLGGHMPKGMLLVGPPGTGKTLLARAVSGEAGVPFFNISGSEFIELFVGVGAARVRDLFDQARKQAPCIIFIDELDAIGRSRGGPMVMGGHDEREQTLNQLLTEMDGFDTSVGVIVMAATNRPEVLDKALLRAGRFDRQIIIDKPDLEDRIKILKLHTAGMQLAKDVDLNIVGKRTPGLVGADLANIANEAAILAARTNRNNVQMQDFEAAIDRVLAGPEKKNRALGPEEKRRVAFHEAGHALVAKSVPTGQPVHKISIIPRGVSALGFTLQLPVEEKFLSTDAELKDQIAILLGGRTAEAIALGNVSTGAQNDLEKASEIARAMVCYLGMSEKLGPLTYGKRQQLQFLETETTEYRNYSDDTARLIDAEVKALVEEGMHRAQEILNRRRQDLDKLAEYLQEKEVIQGDEIDALLLK